MKHLVGAALAATGMAWAIAADAAPTEAVATFAGGCFWCTESDFEKVPGVVSAVSGYIGGRKANPTYEEVSDGGTGHAEAVEVRYDPAKVTYAQLLDVYWHSIDPTAKDRQFCDAGDQYRSAIFTHDAEQKRLAEETRAQVEKQLGVKVWTQIAEAGKFYPAEDYHQDYYKTNPLRYRFYRNGCGRDARLKQLWGEKK